MIMSDDDIEAMPRGLVEEHLAEDARRAALNWLEKRSITYQAMQNLGLLDEDGHDWRCHGLCVRYAELAPDRFKDFWRD
jgi:hypothetical protein